MKTAGVKEIKAELKTRSSKEIQEICLQLSRFKKENKELLTYLLFEASDETHYIKNIKLEVDEQFQQVNTSSYYFIKKSIRKILRQIKKYIRYSKKKETEVELLLYFCQKMTAFSPSYKENTVLSNIYSRELMRIKEKIKGLHEDLQYDYDIEIASLENGLESI